MKGIFLSVILVISLFPVAGLSEDSTATPENTVILSNETDESFCKDFSVLLRRLKPEWIVLDNAGVPESVREKNLIILGGLHSEYTGNIIKEFLSHEEVDHIQDGQHAVIEKENLWSESKIIICTGPDSVSIKKAAEEAITSLDGEWIDPPFISVPYEKAQEYLTQIQHIPDEEFPMDELGIDIIAKSPSRISVEQASEDVEYLFYLFSHGYCGYGYFETEGNFDAARKTILEELEMRSTWSPDEFSQLIRDNLTFIHDCHLSIGSNKYGNHEDFWYDTTRELTRIMGNYYFILDNIAYQVVSVNGEHPDEFMFPSLNVQGKPIYRIGILSQTAPEPLMLEVQHDEELDTIELQLHRSDFNYFSKDIFQEETIGGIPVVRIRSFSDHHAEYIDQFLETAQKYRGNPVLIVDIRGNGGGNEKWPGEWITQFTRHEPSSNRYFTELTSKTTMMGRANYFEKLLDLYPDTYFYQAEKDRYMEQADFFEKQYMTPYWSGPFFEDAQVIPNDTTLIIVMNSRVASAAEGFINYLQQVENVVPVGENTRGALVFGQMTLHQLPHSRLLVNLPISLNIPLDLELREEKGFFPDLWIPAGDAVNYAVAAVRNGTISTVKPLTEEILQKEFIPESLWKNQVKELSLPILFLTVICSISVILNRKRDKKFFFIISVFPMIIGTIMVYRGVPVGYVFFIFWMVCISIGGYKWIKEESS